MRKQQRMVITAEFSEIARAAQRGVSTGAHFENMAALLLATGNAEAAADSCRRAIAAGRRGPQLYYHLGCALFMLGDYAGASRALAKAVDIEPDFPEAFYRLGTAFGGLDALEAADAAFQAAIRLRPDYADAHYIRGVYAAVRGEPGFAIHCLAEALRIKPGLPPEE